MSVTLPELLLAVVLLPFLWILGDWMFGIMGERRTARRQRRVYRECHLCGRNYPEGRAVKVSSCPDCNAQNVRGGHRKLG